MLTKMKQKKHKLQINERDFTQVLPKNIVLLIFKFYLCPPSKERKYTSKLTPPFPPPPMGKEIDYAEEILSKGEEAPHKVFN